MNLDSNHTNLSLKNSCHLKTGLRAGILMPKMDPFVFDPCSEPFDPLGDGLMMRRCTNPDGTNYFVIA